jgi:hypothetical protein
MLTVVTLSGLIHKAIRPNENSVASPANFNSNVLATVAFDRKLLLFEGRFLQVVHINGTVLILFSQNSCMLPSEDVEWAFAYRNERIIRSELKTVEVSV